MHAAFPSIAGEPVATRLVTTLEDTMQAFAVRAACFVGELEVPYSREFDGHDFGATHLLLRVGSEPAGTLRLRWFRSFAMLERLAVVPRLRGHDLGRRLLERSYQLAENRGCTALFARSEPPCAGYLEKQGWRRLQPEAVPSAGPTLVPTVAMARSVNPAKPWPDLDAIEARTIFEEFGARNLAATLRNMAYQGHSSSSHG